jgi:parallel beta-helix repeat protein
MSIFSNLTPTMKWSHRTAWFLTLCMLLPLLSFTAAAQCPTNVSTNLTANNSSGYGTTFEVTALRAMELCRIYAVSNSTSSSTMTLEVWAHPNGLPFAKQSNPPNINDGLWFKVGTATVTFTGKGPANYTEIPVDLSALGIMTPTQKWGFAVVGGGVGYKTGSAPYIFSNSDLSIDTQCWGPSGSTGPGNTTNFTFPNFPRQFCGKVSYRLVTSPNDAGISAIPSPLNFCAGTLPVQVKLTNYGTNQLNSATVNWTLNGVPQTALAWTGLLDTLNQATRSTTVTLGSVDFLSGIPYTIAAWTTLPNGVADTVNNNDSTIVTRKSALSGTFTIGGGGSDYNNFKDAVADLVANGVCGPVTMKVRTGSYTEQVVIGKIAGASAVNTITFESESTDPADVTLGFSSGSSTTNYVLSYNGCTWISFRNMTISALGTSYSRVVAVQSGTQYCTLDNLTLNGYSSTSTSNARAVIYAASGSVDNNNTVIDCEIHNGSYGIYWYGSGQTSLESGTVIKNNLIKDFRYRGMQVYYQNAPQILGNTVTTRSTYSGMYAMYIQYCDNGVRITGNKLIINSGSGTKYGMRVGYCDASAGTEGVVSNNFITINNGSSTAYGLYPYRSTNLKLLFNTVYLSTTSTSGGRAIYTYHGSDLTVKNNILYNNGNGYAFYTNNTSNVIESDYNVFYSNGNNIGYWGSARANLAAWRAATGTDANTIDKAVSFSDVSNGDLHLTGVSEDDPDLYGVMEMEVTDDIDADARVLPYRGADEACYITPGSVEFDLVDGNGTTTPYANIPGQLGVKYHVAFPVFDAEIEVTVNFYTIPANTFVYSTSFNVSKGFGQVLDGFSMVPLTGLSEGVYRVEVVFNTKNSCGNYRDYLPGHKALMLLPQGQTPCLVWPGDVNNDGIVNYGDRKSLNTYIHDANLSPLWLNGPARYRADAGANPLTYLTWEAQASIPWETAEGCYMDTDGNGTVNNFDYIPIKMNWMRTHGSASPKPGDQFSAQTFDMDQNFPNPFNPSTQIQYSVPEASQVRIVVLDVRGREIATLVDDVVSEGTHTLSFSAANLATGVYLAVATMRGLESGLTFDKTIRMQLAK